MSKIEKLNVLKGEIAVTKALVLRTCRADMSSHSGFVWPSVGEVAIAPDWKPIEECGNGLHGWLFGHGDYNVSDYLDETAKWLVVEVELESVIMLGGKCKFERGTVVFIGARKEATDYLLANEERAKNVAVIGASITVGDGEVAAVGALGMATAGYRGMATAGYRGTATAGNSGTATAGDRGTATAGYSGTATAGYSGTATAGNSGEIRIRFWDGKADRYRTKVGYIGEDGLLPNVAYRLNDKFEFEAAE